ncbi:hypothetical protein Tco_1510730 [Tanacetum coccineum]
MAQYPELATSDRANVVCRVFEKKIQSFVTFLKEERIFGNVIGDSESKIKSAEDVDQYISAELPDPRIDPDRYNIVSETMMHGPCGAANLKASCMKELVTTEKQQVIDWTSSVCASNFRRVILFKNVIMPSKGLQGFL